MIPPQVAISTRSQAFAQARIVISGIGIVAALLVAITPKTAWACTCAPWTREQYIKDSADIVRATVYDIRPVAGHEFVSFEIEFQVSESWKGSRAPRIVAYAAGLDAEHCSVPFRLANDYIVYVSSVIVRGGETLPFISICGPTTDYSADHAAQLDSELGQRKAISVTPTPRPTRDPTPAICPSTVPDTPEPPPMHEPSSFTSYLPVVITTSQVKVEPTATGIQCVTPTPMDLSVPPAVIMTNGRSASGGGLGSRCWWPANQCHETPGIASLPDVWVFGSPFTVKVQLAPRYPAPTSWQLSMGEVGPLDYSQVPGEIWWFWHPKELHELMLNADGEVPLPLDLALGNYVFKLRVEWGHSAEEPGALGWVEYGWAVKIIDELNSNSRTYIPQ